MNTDDGKLKFGEAFFCACASQMREKQQLLGTNVDEVTTALGDEVICRGERNRTFLRRLPNNERPPRHPTVSINTATGHVSPLS